MRSGQVEKVEVQATSGSPRLDEAALSAVRRLALRSRRARAIAPVAGWAVVPVAFSLQG
jgi:protein TonB